MGFAELLAAGDAAALEVLGAAVTYSPGTGPDVEVQGIFDAVYVLVDGAAPGISTSGPAIWFLLSDLPSDPETDTAATVTVGATEYTAHTVQKDGTGGVRLLLHEV